jgi:type II secretory pathway component GspD/PulD (secretin)
MKKIFLTAFLLSAFLVIIGFSQNVSVSFFQESLSQALSDLAAQENITILTDSTVGGFITLNLDSVSISEALDLMLLPGGFSWKEIKPGVYFVGTPNPSSSSFLYLASSTSYRLKYITSKTLLDLLPDVMKPYVFTSTDSPSLVLIGAPDSVKSAIVSLIKKVDIPKNEIVVQMNVIEVDESLLKKWGMDLQYSNPSNSSSSTTFNVLNRAINFVYKVNDLSILSNIKAEAASGSAKILANPKIRITSGNTGKVSVSTTRNYSYTNSNGKTVVSSVKMGVDISLTPTISASGDVSMNLSETLSGAMENSGPVPDTMTNTLSTVFNTHIGKTVAVGGTEFSTYEKSTAKVPLLSDIPIIGYFFTQEKMKKVKKEIIIIITCESAGDKR